MLVLGFEGGLGLGYGRAGGMGVGGGVGGVGLGSGGLLSLSNPSSCRASPVPTLHHHHMFSPPPQRRSVPLPAHPSTSTSVPMPIPHQSTHHQPYPGHSGQGPGSYPGVPGYSTAFGALFDGQDPFAQQPGTSGLPASFPTSSYQQARGASLGPLMSSGASNSSSSFSSSSLLTRPRLPPPGTSPSMMRRMDRAALMRQHRSMESEQLAESAFSHLADIGSSHSRFLPLRAACWNGV